MKALVLIVMCVLLVGCASNKMNCSGDAYSLALCRGRMPESCEDLKQGNGAVSRKSDFIVCSCNGKSYIWRCK